MVNIAVIGGSGLDKLSIDVEREPLASETPYGHASAGAFLTQADHCAFAFLPRHGDQHQFPPHKVNYRANICLLKSLGVKKIIAINVVGGISQQMKPLTLVVPDQVIDYTYGREHTFFDGQVSAELLNIAGSVQHIDFSFPYSPQLRSQVEAYLNTHSTEFIAGGVYGCTQGPRLETAAEVRRLAKDGCDIVGMTSMPEAALARELSMEYVSICLVVNWAAGIASEELKFEAIMENCEQGMALIQNLLPKLLNFIDPVH